MPPSSRRGICSVSRRVGSGSYSTVAGLPLIVAAKSPWMGLGAVFLWIFLMTGWGCGEGSVSDGIVLSATPPPRSLSVASVFRLSVAVRLAARSPARCRVSPSVCLSLLLLISQLFDLACLVHPLWVYAFRPQGAFYFYFPVAEGLVGEDFGLLGFFKGCECVADLLDFGFA